MKNAQSVRKQIICGHQAVVALVTMLKHSTNLNAETISRLDSVLDRARKLLKNHLAAVKALQQSDATLQEISADVADLFTKRSAMADKVYKAIAVLDDLEGFAQKGLDCETATLRALLPAIQQTVKAFVASLYDLPRFNEEANQS